MITILGYIGTVITLSALFVAWILSRPERFNLEEESEAIKDNNKIPHLKITDGEITGINIGESPYGKEGNFVIINKSKDNV